MTLYAQGTEVSEARSKAEIDDMLRKWKATSTAIGEDQGCGVVIFVVGDWHVRFRCPMPTMEMATKHVKPKRGSYYATQSDKDAWLDSERRRRWRALLITIKAKLVSVENGIEKFEEAFLAHIVIAGGLTVGQKALPELASIYKSGTMPNGGLLGSGA